MRVGLDSEGEGRACGAGGVEGMCLTVVDGIKILGCRLKVGKLEGAGNIGFKGDGVGLRYIVARLGSIGNGKCLVCISKQRKCDAVGCGTSENHIEGVGRDVEGEGLSRVTALTLRWIQSTRLLGGGRKNRHGGWSRLDG